MYRRDCLKNIKIDETDEKSAQYGLTIPMIEYMKGEYREGKYRDEVYIKYPKYRKVGKERKVEFSEHTSIMMGAHNNTSDGFSEHINSDLEMMYVVSGHATNIINGETVTIGSSDCLISKKGALHKVLPSTKEDITVNFIIPDTFFNSQFMYYISANAWFHSFFADSSRGYLHCRGYEDPDIRLLAENMMCEFLESDELSVINIRMYLVLFLNLYFRLWKEKGGELPVVNGRKKLKLHEIYDYIERNICTASLKDMALRLNYDSSYLSRFIQKNTGKSFTALKQEICIKKAMDLLCSSSLSVSKIMALVGFHNSDHFYKIFQDYCGMNPSQYREYMKKESALTTYGTKEVNGGNDNVRGNP